MLRLFKSMFGGGFFNNTAFLFTRWGMTKKDLLNRKKQNDTEEGKKIKFNAFMYEKGLTNTTDMILPCFFIDNSLNDVEVFEYSSEEEQEAYLQTIESIKVWLSQLPKFECKDMQVVEMEKQKLQREKDEAIQAAIELEEKSKEALA